MSKKRLFPQVLNIPRKVKNYF